MSDLKALLKTASAKDNAFAIKHAAAIFAVAPNEQLADKELALSTALKLKKYDDSLDPQVNEVIAAAHAVNDNYSDAIKQQERAIKKAQKLHWNTQYMEERLTAYRQGRHPTGDLLAVPATTEPLPPVGTELPPCTKKAGCRRQPDAPRVPTGSMISR